MQTRSLIAIVLLLLSNLCYSQENEYSAEKVARVIDIQLAAEVGSDLRPIVPTLLFNPKNKIYVVITTTAPDTQTFGSLGVAWRFGSGDIEEAVHSEGRELVFSGDGTTLFQISKPDGWPHGEYSVEVFLNGKSVRRLRYKVQ